ncbi:MAG: transglycosylase domain-containing protein [Aquihabitans sp.]
MRTRKPVPVHNLKVTRKGKVKKRSIVWRMRRVFYLAALALMVGASGLVYVLTQIELPVDPQVAQVQKQTSFICASDVAVNCNSSNAMAQLHGSEDRVLVVWEQIPQVLRDAVVSAEDRDFFRHGGVDPVGITRAALADIRGSGVRQGGSTITQQYVKQEYLSSEQTITRKIKEAVMAIKLEQKISKEEILTRYLNTVYFGRGAYGVQAASRTWFGHDVEALNAGEASFLAGLLRNPNGADPFRGPNSLKEAKRRRTVVLSAMVEEGYLTEKEMALFEAVPIDPEHPGDDGTILVIPPPKASILGDHVKGEEYGSKYFAEHVRRWLVDKYGTDAVLGGGLKVYTTLDLKMQKAAFDTVTTTLNQDGDPSASIVALDDEGRVRAMMGGTDFDHQQYNLATGAGGTGRGSGSTFKMFALADLARQGYSVQSVLPSPTKVTIDDPQCGELWEPEGGPGGASSMVTATKNSINTTYAQLMVRLGPDSVAQTAMDMGVASLEEQRPECSWVLGTAAVTVLDMAAGYSTIANEGVAKTPIVVTKVEFPDGRVDDYAAEEKEVLTTDQAGRVRSALEEVIEGGTGRAANIGRPAAGKTGTTQNNADAWFAGFTPNLTAVVWMGYPTGLIPMDNVHGLKVQGGNFPAEMWAKFMKLVTDGTEVIDFPEIDAQTLADGEILDPNYGKTSVVADGNTSGDNGGIPTATTPPPVTMAPTTQPSVAEPPPTTEPVVTTEPVATTQPVATTAPPTSGPPAGDGPEGG